MVEEQHHSLTAPKLWFMTAFANHIWCLDHLNGLTHLSCISRLTKMSKMTNTFYVLLMKSFWQGQPQIESQYLQKNSVHVQAPAQPYTLS